MKCKICSRISVDWKLSKLSNKQWISLSQSMKFHLRRKETLSSNTIDIWNSSAPFWPRNANAVSPWSHQAVITAQHVVAALLAWTITAHGWTIASAFTIRNISCSSSSTSFWAQCTDSSWLQFRAGIALTETVWFFQRLVPWWLALSVASLPFYLDFSLQLCSSIRCNASWRILQPSMKWRNAVVWLTVTKR